MKGETVGAESGGCLLDAESGALAGGCLVDQLLLEVLPPFVTGFGEGRNGADVVDQEVVTCRDVDEQGLDGGEDLRGEAANEVERHDEGDVFAFLRSVAGKMFEVFHVGQ
ncbi:hypothetical protein DLM49_36210 [Streptomyces sp. WAC 01438]|nr:hypothetical protein DLM49_36210 [Streptomyces sp. WAC 01438]